MIAPDFCFGHTGKQLAYFGKETAVGCRVAARCSANGALVYFNYFVNMLQSFDGLVRHYTHAAGFKRMIAQQRIQSIVDEGALATTAYATHHNHFTQRQFHRNVLQRVSAGPFQFNGFAIALAPLFGHRYGLLTTQKVCRFATILHHLLWCAAYHYTATMPSGFRANVYQKIAGQHDVFIMLYHQHTVANIPQVLQCCYQPVVVPLVQTNRRLVEYVGNAL